MRPALITLAMVVASWSIVSAQSDFVNLDAVRRSYLSDLTRFPDYAPGKNSFLLRQLHSGDRRTLLNIRGSGSVRHIWSTWSVPGDDSDIPAPGSIFLRVFVDDAIRPAISGCLDDLFRAAAKTKSPLAPFPAFNYKGAFNLYLPIFFDRGIRIEIEAKREIEEFYTQIDYRTENHFRREPRLISDSSDSGLILRYLPDLPSSRIGFERERSLIKQSRNVEYGPGAKSAELTIEGSGILRQLALRGKALSDLKLEIYWDDDKIPSVDSPLKYFFADFVNAAVESKEGRSSCYFVMPFRTKARLVISSLSGRSGGLSVEYVLEKGPISAQTMYLHAQYNESKNTTGYEQYSVLMARGEGLFIGMNLFDSGHNHGGGDAALLDAGTGHPRVLHGICGEDYFGFAWHHTGAMTPLTGAPVHERRYRLHLENPYPFHESIQVLFGVFANQHPKNVAFWYQLPVLPNRGRWISRDIPWKILGPLNQDTRAPANSSAEIYSTEVPIKEETKLEEQWQDIEMRNGFIDATYQFRHYAMVESGTGFVAGASKTVMLTFIYSPSKRKLESVVGHDDRVSVVINDHIQSVAARKGFGRARMMLPMLRGWNKLEIVVYNDENVDWRWCGISLAFDRTESTGLLFSRNASQMK